MVRVTITRQRTGLGGDELLGYIDIANDGSGTATVGHYNFTVLGRAGQRLHTGRILGFPRKQQGAFRLLKLALDQMYPSTQPGRRRRWPGRRKQQQQTPALLK